MEGPEREYTVIERVPPPAPEKIQKHDPFDPALINWDMLSEDYDDRPVTLKADFESVKVHMVEAVSFKTQQYGVKRYRWERTDEKNLPFEYDPNVVGSVIT